MLSTPSFEQVCQRTNFIFDLDGTLVDSSPLHADSFLATLTRYPEIHDVFDYELHKGRKTLDVFSELLPHATPAELRALTEEKQQRYRDAVAAGAIRAFPGVVAALPLLAGAGKRLFLGTGASGLSTQQVLRSLGFAHYFTGVITSDDVARGKPDPECFLAVLERWDLDPEDSLTIEDGAAGIEASAAAGIDCIWVNARGSTGPSTPCARFETFADFADALQEACGRAV